MGRICLRLCALPLAALLTGSMLVGKGKGGDGGVQAGNHDHIGSQAQWCALHFVKQEFHLAIDDCDVALHVDASDAELYLNRGASHLMIGNADVAMSDFDAGLRLKPDDAMLHFNRATVLTSKGKHEDAIAGYTAALRFDPNLVSAYMNRGSSFDLLGEHKKAIADYRKALELAPFLTTVRRRLQWLEAQ